VHLSRHAESKQADYAGVLSSSQGGILAILLAVAVVVTPPTLPPRLTKMPLTIRFRGPHKDAGGGQSEPEPARRGRSPASKQRKLLMLAMVARNEHRRLLLRAC
jgi:hypothetical protein